MTCALSATSRKRLRGVHPDMAYVVKRAIKITTQDFMVLCGVRTKEEQAKEYAKGRTAPGEIVTWTLNSRHLPAPDGYGYAVDLVPYPVDWKTLSKFDAVADAMFRAAKDLGYEIRWGADWDRDGVAREAKETDSPHFELVRRGLKK